MTQPTQDDFGQLSLVLVLVLGLGAVGLSVVLGKDLVLHEVVYEFGVVLLTIALIEQMLVRIIRRLMARQTELERLSAELDESSKRSHEKLEEIGNRLNDIKLDNIFTTIHKMDQLMGDKLEQIHRATDPAYAKAVHSSDR